MKYTTPAQAANLSEKNSQSGQFLNLNQISIPNASGNINSVPLMFNSPAFAATAGPDSILNNNMKIATKLIANFFSPVRALASKPVFNIINNEVLNNSNELFLIVPQNKVYSSTNTTFSGLAESKNQKKSFIPLATDLLSKNKELSANNLKVVINLFYYITNKNQALSDTTVNSLGSVLAKLFGYPVELRLVRLHYPYLNSHILAQYVAINTKKYNFTRIQRAIFGALLLPRPKSIASEHLLRLNEGNGTTSLLTTRSLPSHITGIMIRISGRLVTQRSIPRQTVQTAHIGTFSHSKGAASNLGKNIKNVIESASLTCKNKKGAFTVKVWISQLPSLVNNIN